MTGPTALDYVTLGIAAVGAVTGVAALAATWTQFVLSGPRLKISSATALGNNGVWYLSVGLYNGGRAAATIQSVSLEIYGTDQHMPLGMAMQQGYATGPAFPLRVEPYTEETWLVRPEPFVGTLTSSGRTARVVPVTKVNNKNVRGRPIDLANIARLNDDA